MAEREAFASERRRIAAPPALVWALVADTDRFDRASGLTPGRYEFRELTPGDPKSRARVAQAKELGIDIEWIEPPYDWVEGRFVSGERRFLRGPAKQGGFRVDIAPDRKDPNASVVEARATVSIGGAMGPVLRAVMRRRFAAALRRYLDAIESVLSSTHASLGYDWNSEPPAAAARRALLASRTTEAASGRTSPTNAHDLEFRAREFGAPVAREVRDRLVTHLRDRPDEEVRGMRPFELARAWGLDKRDVLRGFLHATRCGLIELNWQINCPVCRVGSQVATSLGDVGKAAHCDACNITYDSDFARHIEAVFRVNGSIRAVDTAVYCASSPWFRPHVFAQLHVGPRQTRLIRCPLPASEFLVRTLNSSSRAEFDTSESSPTHVSIRATPDALHVELRGSGPRGGDASLEIANESSDPIVVVLERAGWHADAATGNIVATFPDFVDLFATEAPATGVELAVSNVTMLFSDLSGSTAAYRRLGDARAFATVEKHFRDVGAVIDRHNGAIVKTMGDAVMAAFASPADAVRAAVEMVRETERAAHECEMRLKVGVHTGPCLAVRANDWLDYFGTTVNIAARLQAQAHEGFVVVAESLLEHREVRAAVETLPSERFEATLKGLEGLHNLVSFDARILPAPS